MKEQTCILIPRTIDLAFPKLPALIGGFVALTGSATQCSIPLSRMDVGGS